MPPLPNVRQEKFVQALFEGHSATESYKLAGYKPNQGNSSRLKWYDSIQTRLTELQMAAAKNSEITVESICAELDQANQIAMEKGQASAMVSASALRAKLAGLLTDKIEAKVHVSGDFNVNCDTSMSDIAHQMAYDFSRKELAGDELAEFTELVSSWYEQFNTMAYEYLDNCSAKVVGVLPELERQRLGLTHGSPRRITNGNGR